MAWGFFKPKGRTNEVKETKVKPIHQLNIKPNKQLTEKHQQPKRFSTASVRSVRSARSIASQSHSSLRSGNLSIRARHIKAAHQAKIAAHAFFNATVNRKCYTCNSDLLSVRCERCRTTYVPPEFRYNAASAALFASTNSEPIVESMLGFLPENELDFEILNKKLDLELVEDLAKCDEGGLLEEIVFECFSNVESVCNTFLVNGVCDVQLVLRFYKLLGQVSSTSPMRGILQGAQAVLQVRQYRPLNKFEVVYICIVLQCPAIAECSMFTKITGPMQKLSRYAGLRSRARIVLETCAGLVANCEDQLHLVFTAQFELVGAAVLAKIVDLCNAYISHRLAFDFTVKTNTSKPTKYQLVKHEWYQDDWRILNVVKLMTLLYQASSSIHALPEYSFYNSMVDFVDLKQDYDAWQLTKAFKRPKFCFCRYPFLLSIGAKARVFEFSIQREVNASIQRACFALMANAQGNEEPPAFPSLYAEVKIRRGHLFKDSIAFFENWHLTPQQRAIKIEFHGEPGIDAGGLTREWVYLFYQQLFDEKMNLFNFDETTNYCWFSNSKDLKYYRAAGMALGFALYNGVQLDIPLPPLIFKLLLKRSYSLQDVGVMWPDIGQSLQQVLDYDKDDMEDVFLLFFSAFDGTPLIQNGDSCMVNQQNKEEYVKLLIEHLVKPEGEQLTAFKSGFDLVCGKNTPMLFQPDELEQLVRGDRKPLDLAALRSVTKYINFGHRYAKANKEPLVQWFWDFVEKQSPETQGRLLQFVTSTDRTPAAGAVHMKFSIRLLGGDSERLPIAHTCFNELCLYNYKTKAKFEQKLTLAISEYQGFGLK